ncbi:MAG: flagellar biosynthesis protein FlhA [Candidatus Wallbacteria bacterium]|nr:flagellar biosynthesis protein FlhA [Candidatus Wallbacteria bacterium]
MPAAGKYNDTLLAKFIRNSDILIAVAVVSVVIMMIIPLPSLLLDILLALNISIAMAILLISMYMLNVLEFSVFPSLLLMVTLFRLALNVSSTRLILLQGKTFGGKIIRAFGDFVVGGNYVVGLVIFLILVVIQFVVITRGATRVAEVAARFTLDAMPGKQMSVDADLQNGLINDEEAKKRRKNIQREADFYGAMDGSSKFVQGDAVAGIIITIVNIVGGLIIGVWQRGEGLVEAAQVYTLLTIGDGLVSQIPALLISTATGIVVTRAASESDLGKDLASQFLVDPKIYFIISGMLGFMSLIPGMPTVSFLVLGGISFATGWTLKMKKDEDARRPLDAEVARKEEEKKKKTEDVSALLQIDPMELEIGYSLIPLVDTDQGGDLLDRIKMIRRQMVIELGLIVPPVRIRDNMQIEPNEYTFHIKGFEVGRGKLITDHYLAMNMEGVEEKIEGQAVRDPVFGLPALWISEKHRATAEVAGYTVVDPPTVVATHLTEIIKRHAHDILGQEELKEIMKNVEKNYPLLVQEVQNQPFFKEGTLLRVLQNLLREGVSIRNMVPTLETCLEKSKLLDRVTPDLLTEFCRAALAQSISRKYLQPDGSMSVMTIDPRLEDLFRRSVQGSEVTGRYISLDAETSEKLFNAIKDLVNSAADRRVFTPVFMTAPDIRACVKRLMERVSREIVVISFNEIIPETRISSVGVLEI